MKLHVNQKQVEAPEGATLKSVAEQLHMTAPEQAVTASVNGVLRDFSYAVQEGDQILFFGFDDAKGKEVFWHTSAHVLAQAVMRLFPQAQPTIGPPIENGFYYDFANLTLSDTDFERLEKEVEAILAAQYLPERVDFANK